jgi:hypothetical protein
MPTDLNGQLTHVALMSKKILVAAGTQTADGVDVRDFIGNLKVTIHSLGDNGDGGATIVYSLQDSADNTTFAALSSPAPVTVTAASFTTSIAVDTRATRRYLQAKALTASSTATFVAGIIGVGLKQRV